MNNEERSVSWFVRDDPVADLSERDHFGHQAYAEVLADAILKATPPFTIGVFGSWGVGKTTIAKTHLAEALQAKKGSEKIAYAYFDVWKYEDDSLRRQFLREVASQFKTSKVVPKAYDPEKELQDLVVDRREPIETKIQLSRRQLLISLIRGLIAGAATFVVLRILETQNVAFERTDVPLSVLVALLTVFLSEGREVLMVGKGDVTRRTIDAPDLFELKFKELMDKVDATRAVIVIDNLDRCTPDRVMEVLSTIKTFLEPVHTAVQPIFVVPCDHVALRRHLEQRGEVEGADADEYLRKFFNTTLRINPILEEEIREYVTTELDGLLLATWLNDEQRRELVQVITVAFRGNPRRVKQFLNTLTSKLMVIKEREAKGQIDPPISAEVPFLAKLTAIEEEWPELYRAIVADVRNMEQLSEHAVGISGELPGRLETIGDDERLLGFLRGTRSINSTNVRAFTRLKLSPIERRIANYWEYRNALVDGRIEDVHAILEESPESNRRPYQEAAEEILREEVSNGYFEAALNVIDAIIRTESLASPTLARELIERLYSVQELRDLLPSLAPRETLVFLSRVESEASDLLLDEFLKLLPEENLGSYVPKERMSRWQAEVAKGLGSLNNRIQNTREEQLKELCAGSLAQNLQFVYELSRLPNGIVRFISSEAVAGAISRIDAGGLKVKEDGGLQHSFASAVWARGRASTTDENILAFAQRMTELLAQVPGEASAPGREPLLLLIFESRDVVKKAPSPASDQLAEQLKAHYQQAQPDRRWMLVATMGRLYDSLSAAWQQEAQAVTAQFADNEGLGGVEGLVETIVEEGLETFPEQLRNILLSRLKERFRVSTQTQDHEAIAGMLVTYADTLGWEHLQELLVGAIDSRNMSALINALGPNKSAINERRVSVLAAILSHVLVSLPKFPPSEQATAAQGVWMLSEFLDDEGRMTLRDHVVKLVTADDASVRKAGLDILNDAESRSVFGEAERRHVAEQVILWLMGRAEQLDDSYRPVFDRVLKEAGLVEEGTIDNLITVMKALLARHGGMSALAGMYLASLPLPAKRRDAALQEVIHAAREESDEGQRHQLVRRANDMASKDRRAKGAKALDAYLINLKNGSAGDKALAEEILGTDA